MPRPKHSEQSIFERRLSPYQYAMLTAIRDGKAHHGDETLQIINHRTLRPLIRRDYVMLDFRHNPILTELGLAALETYDSLEMPVRAKAGSVPDYIEMMLRIVSRRKTA